jgi:hypothetical protein
MDYASPGLRTIVPRKRTSISRYQSSTYRGYKYFKDLVTILIIKMKKKAYIELMIL